MADRNTPMKDGELIGVPVAADTKIEAGKIVVADASGYAQEGLGGLNLQYLGRADETVDNTSGANGDKTVTVRRKKAFKWKNSSGDPVDQSCLGKECYIEDDETVAKTDAALTLSAAGKVIGLETDGGIWVE